MTVVPAIPAHLPATPAITAVSELPGQMPKASMADGVTDAMAHLRQESLKNADAAARIGPRTPADTLADARAALRPGPAAHQPLSGAQQTVQSLEMLSQMTWRMVTFEVGNASLQKTDKSIKMFIQAQ